MNNWSCILCKVAEIINDTIPSYRIDSLQERYNEALLKTADLTLKANDALMRKSNIT